MPQQNSLPADLQQLTNRQFLSISDVKFTTDVQRLAESIRKILNSIPRLQNLIEKRKRRFWFSISFGVVLIGLVIVMITTHIFQAKKNPGSPSGQLAQNNGADTISVKADPNSPPVPSFIDVNSVTGVGTNSFYFFDTRK